MRQAQKNTGEKNESDERRKQKTDLIKKKKKFSILNTPDFFKVKTYHESVELSNGQALIVLASRAEPHARGCYKSLHAITCISKLMKNKT